MIIESRKRAIKIKRLKILTSKQMLKRSPIAVVQVKSGNTSEILLNEICQLMYYMYQAKKIKGEMYQRK